jgi:hypothetical protein
VANRKLSPASLNLVYLILCIAALAIFGVGLYQELVHPGVWTMLAAGCLSLIGVAASWPIAHALAHAAAGQDNSQDIGAQLNKRLDQALTVMTLISEQQLLSERAKTVAFRDNDREAIRRAVNEELSKGEWEAAFALADQFEKAFGSKAEADRFRAEISDRRSEGMRKQIAETMLTIDQLTRAEQWSGAIREAEKLMAQLPDHPDVKRLPLEIENRRQTHKQALMQTLHEAAARHDWDGALDILRQVDPYLTPAEAESMQEMVRTMFKEKLNNLAAQFATLVRERKWAEAIRTGEQIQKDFPNSRIAQEVNEKMNALRTRASEPAGASA